MGGGRGTGGGRRGKARSEATKFREAEERWGEEARQGAKRRSSAKRKRDGAKKRGKERSDEVPRSGREMGRRGEARSEATKFREAEGRLGDLANGRMEYLALNLKLNGPFFRI
jgi:hypothetical protein